MITKKNITKTAFISVICSSLSLQAASIGNPTGSLEFKTQVALACGITINTASGGINFDGTSGANDAAFTVYSNSKEGAATVNFTSITPTTNISSKGGYFKVNSGADQNWPTDFTTSVTSGDTQTVSAHVPVPLSEIEAGEAKVTTTIEIKCS